MNIIDFTNCKKTNKMFDGANGSKYSIIYNNEYYMLKFPAKASRNERMNYSNSVDCEYLACKILSSFRLNVQEVLVGKINLNNKEYRCIACKDFTRNGWTLQDFVSFKNTKVDSLTGGRNTELTEILNIIEEQELIEPVKFKTYFWNMFVADAFIGNWDRHNGNWGLLYNQEKDSVRLAPLYDCGSSLYPQADSIIMQDILEGDKQALNTRIYDTPTSAIMLNGKRINYYDFLTTYEDRDLKHALLRFQNVYNADKISDILINYPYINLERYKFYVKMLNARKELILDEACKKKGININRQNIKVKEKDKFSEKPQPNPNRNAHTGVKKKTTPNLHSKKLDDDKPSGR